MLPPHFGVNINVGGEPLTITYDGNGGELPIPEIPDPDEDDEFTVNLPNYPKTTYVISRGRDHVAAANMFAFDSHDFSSWNTKADTSGEWYAAGDVIKNVQAGFTLYAQWGCITS